MIYHYSVSQKKNLQKIIRPCCRPYTRHELEHGATAILKFFFITNKYTYYGVVLRNLYRKKQEVVSLCDPTADSEPCTW